MCFWFFWFFWEEYFFLFFVSFVVFIGCKVFFLILDFVFVIGNLFIRVVSVSSCLGVFVFFRVYWIFVWVLVAFFFLVLGVAVRFAL